MQTNLRSRQRQNVGLAFGLSLLLVLAAYFLLGYAPFGDDTILTGDLNGLYVNYITDMWRRVRAGGFFYSFSKLCGGSTLGLFAYYMSSPFNLAYLIFPVRAIPYVAQGVFALRVACTGAACCFYLQRHCKSASRLLPVLSLGYSLCAFCVVYNQNIIWMDVVLLAPLVLWAMDELVDKGRHWPLTFLVLACILLNFYTAWEVCLFTIPYFAYRWWGTDHPAVPLKRRFGLFAASGVLGAGLGLVLLVPALLEVEESKGGLFAMEFSLTPNFSLAELPYRLFFGNFFWDDVTGTLPNIYCGVFCVVLAVLFFAGPASRRHKLAAGAVLGVMVLSFWIYGIDLIWHGFKQPVWFPCRYSFLVSLFVVLLAAKALLAAPPRPKALALAGVLGAVWCAGYVLVSGETFSVFKLAATAAVFAGTLACVVLLRSPRRILAMSGAAGFALLVMADMGANTVLALRKFESYTVSGFEEFYDQNTEAVDAIRALDGGYYRIEKNFMRTLNDPMLLGYWGISHYSSTKASTAKELLECLGYVNYSTYGWGSTALADSLLGIRYLYSDGSRMVPGHYEQLDTGTELTVWENPYTLPMAYVGSSDALNVSIENSENTFTLQNAMLSALVPGAPDALLPAELNYEQPEQGILLTFTAPCDGPCYLAIPGLTDMTPSDVAVNGTLLGEYFTGDSLGGVFPLGTFAKGEQVELRLGFADSEEARAAIQVYSLDESVLAAACATLQATEPQKMTIREGGHIDLMATGTAEADLLVLPFAWEDAEHWKLTVNGEKAETECVFGGFIGVHLPEGENHVELNYAHPGAGAGLAGTLLCGVLVAVWFAREKRRAAAEGDKA